jgi:hypothetical protein
LQLQKTRSCKAFILWRFLLRKARVYPVLRTINCNVIS